MSRSHAADARHATDAGRAPREGAKKVQAREPNKAAPLSNQAVVQALGAGAPLEPAVRAEMEQRFGTSFADVRVHDDERAHRTATDLEAKAFTHGSDIAFASKRYEPHEPQGQRLLAHELAHVVQQRRGGQAPELAPSASHETAAEQTASQVTAGAPSVAVAGATGVGVARELDDERARTTGATSSALGDLPLGDAARVLRPGAGYWVTHTPDLAAMSPMEKRDEAEQVKEKLFIQTQSSPETVRLEQVRDLLESSAAALPHATDPGAKKKKRRKDGGPKPQAGIATPSAQRLPLSQRQASSTDPAQVTRDYENIVRDLGREDLTEAERAGLQLELDTIEPLVQQELGRRAVLRYGALVDQALTPEDRYYGADRPLIEHMRRIDSIKASSDEPGMNYLVHGRERIPVSDTTLRAIRTNALHTLVAATEDVRADNKQVVADYQGVVDKTFEDHPIVGAISMIRSEQNPLDWEEKLLPIVATSNTQAGQFLEMHKAARDPWNGEPASLEDMARKVDAAQRLGEGAQNYLDYKTDQLHEGTRGAIRHLGRMKTAGQVASTIAFSPLGGALYSATESTLEQLSEMHYGQREHFDYLAPLIDAGSAYVGGKVTGGLLGLGKSAPMWLRVAAFVPADRLGAAATTITHESIDRVLHRSDKGFSDIMGDAGSDLLDWKQAGFNLLMVGFGHAVKARSGSGRTGESGPAPEAATRTGPSRAGALAGKVRSVIAAGRLGITEAVPATAMPTGTAGVEGGHATVVGAEPAAPGPTAKPAAAAAVAPSTEETTQAPAAAEVVAPGGEVSRQSTRTTDDPASFGDASFDALVRDVRNSPLGHRLEAGKRAGFAPLREDANRSRARVDEVAHSQARQNAPPGQVPGAQIQHDTKTLDVTRDLPAAMLPLHPDVINENLRWLQSRRNLPATELLVDPNGRGTRYYVDSAPRGGVGDVGTPGPQLSMFPEPQAAPPEKTYRTEHKFADAYLIPAQAEKIAAARRQAGLQPLDPRMLAIAAGEMARWRTTGDSGTQRSGVNLDLAGAATQRPLALPVGPAPSPQLSFPLFDMLQRMHRSE